MFPATTQILIVDDQPLLREQVRTQLKGLGLGVEPELTHQAGNGKEAIEVLERQLAAGKAIGLIFSDWEMPEMDGMSFIKAIRADARFQKIPLIMVTSFNTQAHVLEAIKAGANNYIPKPCTPAVLQDKLKRTWASIKV